MRIQKLRHSLALSPPSSSSLSLFFSVFFFPPLPVLGFLFGCLTQYPYFLSKPPIRRVLLIRLPAIP